MMLCSCVVAVVVVYVAVVDGEMEVGRWGEAAAGGGRIEGHRVTRPLANYCWGR
jgi:hypothetical protein